MPISPLLSPTSRPVPPTLRRGQACSPPALPKRARRPPLYTFCSDSPHRHPAQTPPRLAFGPLRPCPARREPCLDWSLDELLSLSHRVVYNLPTRCTTCLFARFTFVLHVPVSYHNMMSTRRKSMSPTAVSQGRRRAPAQKEPPGDSLLG